MKRPILILALLIMTGAIGVTGYAWLNAPRQLETGLQQALKKAGFENYTLPSAQKKLGQSLYSEITLDPDRFSTVKTLRISYSPLKLLLFKKIDSIELTGLDLTGELTPQGQISIAGKTRNENTISLLQTLKTAKNIEIKNARLSLLSQQWGGITIELDAQLRNRRSNTDIQGRVKATQSQLSLNANMEGQITDEGFWDLRMELEQGKFALENLKATRLAGIINISGSNLGDIRLLGELESGGLNVMGFPWQEAAITIDGSVHEPRMILAAKSTGIEDIELGLSIPNMRTPSIFSGNLHIKTLANAFDYLRQQNKLPIPQSALTELAPLNDIQIDFSHQKDLILNIKNEDQLIDIKSDIVINKNSYDGKIQAALLSMASLTSIPNAVGTVNLQGEFTGSNKTIAGSLQLDLSKDSVLPYGVMMLTTDNARLTLDDWQKLTGPSVKSVNCRLRNLKPEHHCTLSLQIQKGQITPGALSLKVAGIDLNVPGIDKPPPEKPYKTLIKINEADINAIFSALKKTGWSGTGYMTGNAALVRKNDRLHIENLYLKNKGIGILKLKDERLFKLMEMEELEKETMKLALENFHYDMLEIKVSGALPDDVTISVFGRGKNPGLMQGRTFSLDFKARPDFTALINTLFPVTKTN
ncbi:MAG: YdbH domain-containing protein [Rhodospirillales bacterium]|nr:YdbH domain-containing protein [Rhodospirillales bacterium]